MYFYKNKVWCRPIEDTLPDIIFLRKQSLFLNNFHRHFSWFYMKGHRQVTKKSCSVFNELPWCAKNAEAVC